MLYQNLRVWSSALTTLAFCYGLSDRANAYYVSRDPVDFSLIFIALAVLAMISINFPWERLQNLFARKSDKLEEI